MRLRIFAAANNVIIMSGECEIIPPVDQGTEVAIHAQRTPESLPQIPSGPNVNGSLQQMTLTSAVQSLDQIRGGAAMLLLHNNICRLESDLNLAREDNKALHLKNESLRDDCSKETVKSARLEEQLHATQKSRTLLIVAELVGGILLGTGASQMFSKDWISGITLSVLGTVLIVFGLKSKGKSE